MMIDHPLGAGEYFYLVEDSQTWLALGVVAIIFALFFFNQVHRRTSKAFL